jgi:hypothetical protein
MSALQHPYYPIIYLRGYAMTQDEIEDTVATPYMGFNLGSTKVKQEWDRSIAMHTFESPLVRLMKDYQYQDSYKDGKAMEGPLPARSVIVYRYYDQASRQIGQGDTPSVPDAAAGLSDLVLKLRDQVCGKNAQARAAFKVYLVAHSMGGLVCRSFLQNDAVGSAEAKALVDKVFTYGTPHNGIEVFGLNVPQFFGPFDINNFSRSEMRKYLALPMTSERVDSLNGKFDPARFFCLVGTNHRDYSLARIPVGPMSDGLVKIENATVQGAPRAFVFRSHSGHFGLVNSEEGYQNLVRFLFGDTSVSARLETASMPLPPRVQAAKDEGLEVRASYLFEATVSTRGAFNINLTERRADDASAIFRSFDELLRPTRLQREKPRTPVLFSVFLDTARIQVGRTLVFGVKIVVRSTEYLVLGTNQRYPAEVLFDETLTIRATVKPEGWRLRYVLADQWSESTGREMLLDASTGLAVIPLENRKGFKGSLQMDFSRWNAS